MFNNDCVNEELEYKSLVFNAGSMNDGTETDPDAVPLGSATSNISILGWLMPLNDTDEYSLTFNVPKDAYNRAKKAQVFINLLTDNSNTPVGDRFSIRLSSLFVRKNGVVDIDDIKVATKNNISIQDSPGNYQYNNYVVEFDLNDIIKSEDFTLLSVARITATNDYAGALLLTSIEFRYLS